MSHKSQYKIPLFWLSKTNAKGEPFTQFGVTLFQSEELQKLPAGVRWVYVCMCAEAKGSKEFQFPRATAARYGIKSTTLRESVKRLTAAGFIEYVSGRTARTPNDYKFTMKWKTQPP